MSTQVKITRVTTATVRDMKKKGERLSMLTAYDYPTAAAMDEAGIDVILVGDSLGMVVQGNEDTLSVTLEEMIYHTSMVARAARRALVVSDMPFLTYHTDETESVRNCGRCIKEGKAQAVKVEGGAKRASLVRTLVNNEIPVMGHIGLTPQSIHSLGGFKVQGKDEESARKLLEDALALEDAGAFSVVLECMPSEVASKITASVKIPTIGIGSGPHCDGQVLVFHDLLGISDPPHPRFVKKYKNLRDEMVEGLCQFAKEVRKGVYPSEEQSYHLQKDPRGEEKERTK